jgi:hypothetical protein
MRLVGKNHNGDSTLAGTMVAKNGDRNRGGDEW